METDNTQAEPQAKTDVLGIISIVMAFVGTQLIGLILGLIGASKAKKEGRSPVLSRIGWILNLVFGVFAVGVLLIVFTSTPKLQRNSRNTVRKNDLAMISANLQEFRAENGYYPASLGNLSDAMPVDPTSAKPYSYSPEPSGCQECRSYTLRATLEGNPSTYTLTSE